MKRRHTTAPQILLSLRAAPASLLSLQGWLGRFDPEPFVKRVGQPSELAAA